MPRHAVCKTSDVPPNAIKQFDAAGGKLCVVNAGDRFFACQAACPTRAISFGDLSDPETKIHALRREPRSYALLGDLGTRPRTTYLARAENPNDALAEQPS